jgi:LysM repeat protein
MTSMTRRIAFALVALVALAVLGVACRGSSADPNAGKGQRVTDPARVPSSTPFENPILFQIRGDGVVNYSGGPPTTVAQGTPTPAPSAKYTVKSGDTCGSIADATKTTTDALLKANRAIDANCSNLHTGDILTIPSASAANPGATVKPGGKTYTVVSGDSCSSIAAGFAVGTAALIAANGIDAACQNLKVGQVLTIPAQ